MFYWKCPKEWMTSAVPVSISKGINAGVLREVKNLSGNGII